MPIKEPMHSIRVRIVGGILIFTIIAIPLLLLIDYSLSTNPNYAKASYIFDKHTIWKLKPKLKGIKVYEGKPGNEENTFLLTLNNMGFRGRHWTKNRTKKQRVIILGDSYVAGLDYPDEEIFTGQIESRLNEVQEEYEVLNASCPAWGIDQSLLRWENEGIAFKPDQLIFVINPNDVREGYIKEHLFVNGLNVLEQAKNRVHFKERCLWYMANKSSIFQYIQSKVGYEFGSFERMFEFYTFNFGLDDRTDWDRPLFAQELDPEVAKAYIYVKKCLAHMQAICSENNVQFKLVILPSQTEFKNIIHLEGYEMGRLSKYLTALNKDLKIPLLDLFEEASKLENPLSLFQSWEYHLNKKGHDFVAAHLSEFIQEK